MLGRSSLHAVGIHDRSSEKSLAISSELSHTRERKILTYHTQITIQLMI